MKIMAVYSKEPKADSVGRSMLVWPDSALVRSGKPVFMPEYESGCVIAVGTGVRVDRLGKSIRKRFSYRYYNEVAPMAFVLSRRNFDSLISLDGGGPEEYVADYSVICGDFIEKNLLRSPSIWSLRISDLSSLRGSSTDTEMLGLEEMLDETIEYASKCNTLKTGDLVAAIDFALSTPVKRNCRLELAIDDVSLLNVKLK